MPTSPRGAVRPASRTSAAVTVQQSVSVPVPPDPDAAPATASVALRSVVLAFAHRDEVAADYAAQYALHAGASRLDVAEALLDELERMRVAGAGLLDTTDAELRARRVLSRLMAREVREDRRMLLFTDRSDVVSVALHVVVEAAGTRVATAVSADPSQVLPLAQQRPWDVLVVDHASLRRSARTAREFLQPLLGQQRTSVVVVTSAFDDAEAGAGATWVPRDLRQVVAACGVVARDPLTERERDVLRAVAQGRSNEQIGRQLTLSLSTVKTYLERIHVKLGSVDRASAVATAVRGGWI